MGERTYRVQGISAKFTKFGGGSHLYVRSQSQLLLYDFTHLIHCLGLCLSDIFDIVIAPNFNHIQTSEEGKTEFKRAYSTDYGTPSSPQIWEPAFCPSQGHCTWNFTTPLHAYSHIRTQSYQLCII